jgi:hypothetical protein
MQAGRGRALLGALGATLRDRRYSTWIIQHVALLRPLEWCVGSGTLTPFDARVLKTDQLRRAGRLNGRAMCYVVTC